MHIRLARQTRTNGTGAAVAAGVCGLAAAWIAAGDAGLLSHAMRHALTWLLLGAGALLVCRRADWKLAGLAIGGAPLALVMTASSQTTINVLAVAVFLALLAAGVRGRKQLPLALVAETAVVLGVFHFCRTSIPFLWQAADALGTLLGASAGRLTGRELWVGSTFAGIDYLVASIYLAVMAPLRAGQPASARPVRADSPRGWPLLRSPLPTGLAAVLVAHALYLLLLTGAASLLEAVPLERPLISPTEYQPAPFRFSELVHLLLPWNALLAALVLHSLVCGWILARSAGRTSSSTDLASPDASPAETRHGSMGRAGWVWTVLLAVLAASLPWTLASPRLPDSLEGKRIVFYEKGFLNWLKPRHGDYGRYSSGMYGMLPDFVRSLGAEVVLSPELAPADLDGADALILIYPNEPWREGQLQRIWSYVREGGSLLVLGEHTTRAADGGNRFNDVLQPTAMRVRFDSATFAIGGWLQSYEALRHPASRGVSDTENDFGVVIGASVDVRPPARPLLAGRWGWADPGDVRSPSGMMGNGRYDSGEKLGDLVLVAEQSFGRGKIVAFGDTSSFSNGINMGCHGFTSRLMAYLAQPGNAQVSTSQLWLGLLTASILLVLLAYRPDGRALVAVPLALAAALAFTAAVDPAAEGPLPRSRSNPPVPIAYVDAAHLESYSRELWREDGIMGLCLTLMRNGYHPLLLPELTRERLEGAELLICIAPGRSFTRREREAVEQFVRRGGTLIFTVGRDRIGPSEELLGQLGFRIGAAEWKGGEPVGGYLPLGHFKTPYGEDGQRFVRFHAAWPVFCRDERATVVTFYPPDHPLIVVRPLGSGRVAVIGDTCFAMNKNLEQESGEPFEGMRENADFWQWFLAALEDGRWN